MYRYKIYPPSLPTLLLATSDQDAVVIATRRRMSGAKVGGGGSARCSERQWFDRAIQKKRPQRGGKLRPVVWGAGNGPAQSLTSQMAQVPYVQFKNGQYYSNRVVLSGTILPKREAPPGDPHQAGFFVSGLLAKPARRGMCGATQSSLRMFLADGSARNVTGLGSDRGYTHGSMRARICPDSYRHILICGGPVTAMSGVEGIADIGRTRARCLLLTHNGHCVARQPSVSGYLIWNI